MRCENEAQKQAFTRNDRVLVAEVTSPQSTVKTNSFVNKSSMLMKNSSKKLNVSKGSSESYDEKSPFRYASSLKKDLRIRKLGTGDVTSNMGQGPKDNEDYNRYSSSIKQFHNIEEIDDEETPQGLDRYGITESVMHRCN